MRSLSPVLALAVAAAILSAGCVSGPGPAGDGVDSETSRRDACPAVPPGEQRVASVDEIRCQGHYAFVSEGEGVAWEPPRWEPGESWYVEIYRHSDQECLQAVQETVAGTNESHGRAVYDMDIDLLDCDGEPLPFDSYFRMARTADTLQYLHGNGYIHHDIVPGARDGAEWSFIDNTNRFATVKLEHVPEHPFGNTTMEAWHTEITRVGLNVKHQWWGVEAGNLLREETWTWAGELDGIRHLVDSSRGFGSPAFE